MTEEKYVLTLTREQAITAQNALELYARLKIGQLDRITELMLEARSVDEYLQRRNDANDLLKVVACIIFGRNEYGKPDCQKDALHYRAWNIYAALRYQMAWHDHPEGGWGVHFDKPYPLGGEAVPECRVESAPAENKGPTRNGRWIRVDDTKCKCSECEVITLIAQYPHGSKNFCPNCGAKMDLEGRDENA